MSGKVTKRVVKRRRPSPDERRDQIVSAAVNLFARRGFARTTTREIAAAAGVAEGTIYLYFASKQDLLFAFLEKYAVQPLESLLAATAGDEADVVRGFFLDRLRLAERNRPLMKVVLGEALFDPELAKEFSRQVTGPATARLRAFFAEQVHRGRFRDFDPDTAAGAMAGLFLTFAVLWPTLTPGGRHLPPPEELAEALTSIFLHGVARPQAGPARSRKEPRS